jgi:hypothetical protein
MEVKHSAFVPVYIHKIVERRTEVKNDNLGNSTRTMIETIVEEYNPCLIKNLQERIRLLEEQLREAESSYSLVNGDSVGYFICGCIVVFKIVEYMKE